MSRASVLFPPETKSAPQLPRWLIVVALGGMALVLCSIVPAVMCRARTERDLTRLRDEVTRQEEQVRRLARELRAAHKDSFAHEQALQRLLHPLASE